MRLNIPCFVICDSSITCSKEIKRLNPSVREELGINLEISSKSVYPDYFFYEIFESHYFNDLIYSNFGRSIPGKIGGKSKLVNFNGLKGCVLGTEVWGELGRLGMLLPEEVEVHVECQLAL